jgi:triphosphatase
MPREIELKFLLDAAGEACWRERLAAMAVAEPRRQALHAIYLDTPDHALAARRIALRLRKEGRRWVQTAKIGRAVVAGLSSPLEAECPAPGGRLTLEAIPDPDIRAAVLDAAAGAELTPVCETVIARTRAQVAGPHGGTVEVAIDVGEIRAAGRAAPIREAEIELIAGDAREIYAVAARLVEGGGLRFSRRSKAERGYALARGAEAVAQTPAPVHAGALAFRRSQPVETAAAEVLRSCLDQIAANVAAAEASDAPEGPHQLRVGLRRLRTAFAVFAPAIGGPAVDDLDARARDLAAAAGAVRDLDVIAEAVGADGAPGLAADFAERSAAARAGLRGRLGSGLTSGFVLDLGAFIEARGWLRRDDFGQTALLARPLVEAAAEALDRRWKRCARLAEDIDALEGEARHELRKALKKLRYTVEFFESLWPHKKVRPFLRRLKAMQEDFGALQDLATAQTVLDGPDAPGAADPAAQRAVGLALGRWQARAEADWARAREHWRALEAERRFWR